MPQYVITYLGGNQPSSSEEGRKNKTKYMEWLSSLGKKAVSPMNPFKNTCTINPNKSVNKGSKTAMSGYTIITADSMDDVINIAKACPFLEIGGSLEVSELMQISAQK